MNNFRNFQYKIETSKITSSGYITTLVALVVCGLNALTSEESHKPVS